MKDLSLHILDISENSSRAGASIVEVLLKRSVSADILTLRISDNGKGFESPKKKSDDPYFTNKAGKRFGLGLPLLEQAATECEGTFSISRGQLGGAQIEATFKLSHIDLKPLGDIGATVAVFVGANAGMDLIYRYQSDSAEFVFDTRDLRKELDGLPLDVPQVVEYIKQEINDSMRRHDGG